MTRVYLADALPEERSALRLLLLDLDMEVVGEASDWSTVLAQAGPSNADMFLIDADLFPDAPSAALNDLRKARSTATIIILINHIGEYRQTALFSAPSILISKDETPERIADRLRFAASHHL